MRVSTFSLRRMMPCSAWTERRRPSKANGSGDHADGEGAEALGDLGDHGRTTGAGAAALTRGDEDHVGALEHLLDLFAVLLGGLLADLGVASRHRGHG